MPPAFAVGLLTVPSPPDRHSLRGHDGPARAMAITREPPRALHHTPRGSCAAPAVSPGYDDNYITITLSECNCQRYHDTFEFSSMESSRTTYRRNGRRHGREIRV